MRRQALGRSGTTLLAQGSDGIRLQSQVKLLDEQEGQYMIGSVQFAKPGEALQRGASSAQLDLQPGVSSRPSLDSVLGSARGQALLDSQVRLAWQPADHCIASPGARGSRWITCLTTDHVMHGTYDWR